MEWDGVEPSKISDGARFVFWRNPREGVRDEIATLTIRFDPDSDPPTIKELSLRPDPSYERIVPSDLKRFAWDQWIRAAETIHTTPQPSIFMPPGEDFRDRQSAYEQTWSKYHASLQAAVGHPGSRGRDPRHYQQIAALYQNLVADGERAPIKRLAEDLGVKRNTVSGWIKQARKRGYLPEGTRGRAG
jgi:hypothetical protein